MGKQVFLNGTVHIASIEMERFNVITKPVDYTAKQNNIAQYN
jgi:hypothetical protein